MSERCGGLTWLSLWWGLILAWAITYTIIYVREGHAAYSAFMGAASAVAFIVWLTLMEEGPG